MKVRRTKDGLEAEGTAEELRQFLTDASTAFLFREGPGPLALPAPVDVPPPAPVIEVRPSPTGEDDVRDARTKRADHPAAHPKGKKGRFACDECDRTFTSQNGVVVHKARSHATKKAKPKGAKALHFGKADDEPAVLRCPKCDYTTESARWLTRHQNAEHGAAAATPVEDPPAPLEPRRGGRRPAPVRASLTGFVRAMNTYVMGTDPRSFCLAEGLNTLVVIPVLRQMAKGLELLDMEAVAPRWFVERWNGLKPEAQEELAMRALGRGDISRAAGPATSTAPIAEGSSP